MNKSLMSIFTSLCLFSASGFAQVREMPAPAGQGSGQPNLVSDYSSLATNFPSVPTISRHRLCFRHNIELDHNFILNLHRSSHG